MAERSNAAPWLVLRPVNCANPQMVIGDAKIVALTPTGMAVSHIASRRLNGGIIVDEPQPATEEKIGLFADGYALLDISRLVAIGGLVDCVMTPAALFDLDVSDGFGAAVSDVLVHMRSTLAARPADGADVETDAPVTWPSHSVGGRREFLLSPGIYDMVLPDRSLVVVAGDSQVKVGDLRPLSSLVQIGGAMVGIMRFVGAKPSAVRPTKLPPGLMNLPEFRVAHIAQSIGRKYDGCTMVFAATRSLSERLVARDLSVLISVGAAESTEHTLSLQPIGSPQAQEFNLSVDTNTGWLVARLRDPEGADLKGVQLMVRNPSVKGARGFVASAKVGEKTAIAPGRYVIEPSLQRSSWKDPAMVEVVAGVVTEAVVELTKVLVEVELHVEFKDGTVPAYVAVGATSGDWKDGLGSRRPSSIPMWVPLGEVRFEVVVSDEMRTAVDLKVERGSGVPQRINVVLPKVD